MKLIAKGPDQHDYMIQRIICQNCRSVLDIERQDIALQIVSFVYVSRVFCPECQTLTTIK
jgi:RNase P subunit RPR2